MGSSTGRLAGSNKKLGIPHSYYDDDAGIHLNFREDYTARPDLEGALGRERAEAGKVSLREQLELVTKERDSLKNNQNRVDAAWKRRVQRLEEELEQANRTQGGGHVEEVRQKQEQSGTLFRGVVVLLFFLFCF